MNFGGMTLNERLYLSGKLDQFDKALEEKDIDKLILILKSVEVTEESIQFFLRQMKLVSSEEE